MLYLFMEVFTTWLREMSKGIKIYSMLWLGDSCYYEINSPQIDLLIQCKVNKNPSRLPYRYYEDNSEFYIEIQKTYYIQND